MTTTQKILNATVIVAALGYFVDIYDLLLFSILRVPSLQGIGLTQSQLLDAGVVLLNSQNAGLLVGGILWGVLGDKRGRVSVLFASIAVYSLANIANAFVTTVPQYAALRFMAGVGLAGELGAAITLVSEVMTKETRGYGAAIVASVGILGAVVAAVVGGTNWHIPSLANWQFAYIVGGCLGLVLLFARLSLVESGMFKQLPAKSAQRGDLRMLLASRQRFSKYLYVILVGLPIWFTIGVLVTFSPEFAKSLGATAPIIAGTAILWTYAGASLTNLLAGLISQRLSSRRWAILIFTCLNAAGMFVYLLYHGATPVVFYGLCFLLGLGDGYWTIFVTVASEQFGTNVRATVTTTAPNFVRGSVIPLTILFSFLAKSYGIVESALLVGAGCLLLSLFALFKLDETFGKDLDYLETDAPVPEVVPVGA
ncbi:MAG: MFS transporter [Thermoplasmatota archaeon]